ncbi:MAG: T9SS type A sorting domain-containing protein, partial [Bacteroidota bacterium]
MYIPGHYGSEGIENYVAYLDILPASCYTNWQELPHAYVRWSIEQTFQAIADRGYSIGSDYLGDEKTVMAILELFEGSIPLTEEGTWHDFWLALACDVKGILAFSHFYRNSSSTLTASWNKLNEAIGIFKSENLDQTMLNGTNAGITATIESGPALTPSFDINGDVIQFPSIKTIGKMWNDTLFVIAVNSAAADVAFELDVNNPTFNTYEDVFHSNYGTTGNATIADTLPALGVSFFKFYQSNIPLPVELLSFEGYKKDDAVQLIWETSSESNNRGFEIQKSSDGKSWRSIGFTKSSRATNKYEFVDQSIQPGAHYYRLKQVDFNGQFEYSKIISLSFYSQNEAFLVYPNPVASTVQIETSISQYDIAILDANGKVVQTHQNFSFSTSLDLSTLATGIYSIELTHYPSGQILKETIVKQ